MLASLRAVGRARLGLRLQAGLGTHSRRVRKPSRRGSGATGARRSTRSTSRPTRPWCTSSRVTTGIGLVRTRKSQQLLALDPGNADALYSAGLLARTSGRFDEAISLYQQAIARDPLNARLHNNLGLALYYSGSLAEAEEELRKLLELSPGIARRAGSSRQSAASRVASSRPRSAPSKRNRPKLGG